MDLIALADKYGGLSPQVIGKAQEYLRLLELRIQGGGNAVALMARPAACIELACETLQEPYDSRKLFKLSGGTSLAKHKQTVRVVSSILKLHANNNITVTTAALCVKFGCPALTEFVAAVHDDYKARMHTKLLKSKQQTVDFSRPLFPIAVFYVCAQKANHRVDKAQLIRMTYSHPNEFASVVSSIERLCDLSLAGYSRPDASQLKIGRKRKRLEMPPNKENNANDSNTTTNSTSTSGTRSLDQIKKLIQLQTSSILSLKKADEVHKDNTCPSQQEYVDWKQKVLAKMKTQAPPMN
ncbi:hypothetical protein THRCLA_04677 [Thraustotheca clavata]|uniref:Origin recognition complex subunit 6 n=1 Tax=Thraustotheca clavata TaxID=74557 RepID=A0A1V9ZY87_9STRA|nr:hypothetical protein THRCLA_04677 [Thraustotheca clavata]